MIKSIKNTYFGFLEGKLLKGSNSDINLFLIPDTTAKYFVQRVMQNNLVLLPHPSYIAEPFEIFFGRVVKGVHSQLGVGLFVEFLLGLITTVYL